MLSRVSQLEIVRRLSFNGSQNNLVTQKLSKLRIVYMRRLLAKAFNYSLFYL